MLNPIALTPSKYLIKPLLFFSLIYNPAAFAGNVPDQATAGDKYAGLRQTVYCPQDKNKYGEFKDYGYWGGGSWCGQAGVSGYWVWVSPNWYVWSAKIPEKAHANHKYAGLQQVLKCPSDVRKYAHFKDYGRWEGGHWCGQIGKAGYWVWLNPNWYVWRSQP